VPRSARPSSTTPASDGAALASATSSANCAAAPARSPPTRLGEIVWLEPYPDALLEGAVDAPLGPEARYEQTEDISLAFVTALQVLPARQRAVLTLRQVLGYHASEVAEMLDSTRRIGQQCPQTGPRRPATPPAADRRARTESYSRLSRRAGAGGKVRLRLPVRRR
jgi:hypothetical protein